MTTDFRDIRAGRLAAEVGTIHKQAGLAVALVYPSPYHGRDVVARVPDHLSGLERPARHVVGSRARLFCPTISRRPAGGRLRSAATSRGRPVGDSPVVAFSLAYELELTGLLHLSGLGRYSGLRRGARRPAGAAPLVVVGGPAHLLEPRSRRPLRGRPAHRRGRGNHVGLMAAGWRAGKVRGKRALLAEAGRPSPGSTSPRSTVRSRRPVVASGRRSLARVLRDRTPTPSCAGCSSSSPSGAARGAAPTA